MFLNLNFKKNEHRDDLRGSPANIKSIAWQICYVDFGDDLGFGCWVFDRFFLLILLKLHLFSKHRISVFEFLFAREFQIPN